MNADYRRRSIQAGVALAIIAGIAIAPIEAWGQREHPISEVIRAPAGGLTARPGETFTVTLAVNIPSVGKVWHLYSITQGPGGPIRTQIKVEPAADFRAAGPMSCMSASACDVLRTAAIR